VEVSVDYSGKEQTITFENSDMVDILQSALRAYKFLNRNTLPKKIVIPLMPTVRDYNSTDTVAIVFAPYIPTPTIESDLAEKKGAVSGSTLDSRQQ
jgi:hypothetical protein